MHTEGNILEVFISLLAIWLQHATLSRNCYSLLQWKHQMVWYDYSGFQPLKAFIPTSLLRVLWEFKKHLSSKKGKSVFHA